MKVTKFVFAVMFLVLILLQYRLWLSPDGMQEVWRLRGELETEKQAVEQRVVRNKNLEAEVADLKEGVKAAEERARGELGMVGSDETFYRVVDAQRLEQEQE